MAKTNKRVPVSFYRNAAGKEPVREWIQSLSKEDRGTIGDDLRTLEFGWPRGMPLCRSITGYKGLWEARSKLSGGRIARVLFYICDGEMILLNGFEKKSQKTPQNELETADARRRDHEKHR